MADTNNKLIDVAGLQVFKTQYDSVVDQKIADAGLGVTYTLTKNDQGAIVLTGSDGKSTSVSDNNTEYSFEEQNGKLIITGTDGTSEEINLGEDITSEKIIAALGFTPADEDDIPTESTVSGWGFTKNTGTYSKPDGGIPASDLANGVIPTTLPANGGNSSTVNNHSVNEDVPSGAKFTDTYEVVSSTQPTDNSSLWLQLL